MRAAGGNKVIYRALGERPIAARFSGERIAYIGHDTDGLLYHFTGRDNVNTGLHDPMSPSWIDIEGGAVGELQRASWQRNGVLFAQASSKVVYTGASVLSAYTIINTFTVGILTGQHPRLNAELPTPTMYLHSGQGYCIAAYSQGKDTWFLPKFTPTAGQTVTAAMRWNGPGAIELFINGEKHGEITGVTAAPTAAATKYLGGRADNTRALSGTIHEHLMYTRALTDDGIRRAFEVSAALYGIS